MANQGNLKGKKATVKLAAANGATIEQVTIGGKIVSSRFIEAAPVAGKAKRPALTAKEKKRAEMQARVNAL